MHKRILVTLGFCLSALLIIMTAMRCHPQKVKDTAPAHTWLNTGDSAKYVGINTCKKCHFDIYKTFIETGMGQSFAHASPQKSKGHFETISPLYDSYADLYYQPYWQDTILKLKEYRLAGKDTSFSRTESVSYIIGSGHHTNSHIMDVNGYLYQMPFTFYVQKQKLDLPPGFENGYNSRFNRQLGLECLSCHNAYPGFVQGSINKYTKIPEGIDCERCHGPGSIHVAEKLLGKTVNINKDTDFTIVNPRKLPFALQIDICQRCHLQGDAVLKSGKSFFDFRPGLKLSEVMDIYLPTYEEDENGFLMAAHAQRLKKSQCFIQSNKTNARTAALNCISCHNPHVSVRATGNEFFNNKCKSCHQDKNECTLSLKQRKEKADNCVTCHMPKSGAVDIPHVSITDHYIRKNVSDAHSKKNIGVGKFKGLECLDNPKPEKLSIAKAYMFFYEKFDHKRYNLDSAYKYLNFYPVTLAPEAYIYYYYLREDFPAVVKIAIQSNKTFKEGVANYQAAKSAMNIGENNIALKYFKAALQAEPYNLEYHNQAGTLYLMMHDYSSAEKEFKFIIAEQPKSAMGWNAYALYYLVKENIIMANKYLSKALALDADYEPALLNQVKIALYNNNKMEASTLLNKILKRNPGSTEAKQMKALLISGK